MIIVEGADNTGKTTLVQRLIKDIPELQYGGRSPGHCPEMVVRIAETFLVKRPHETTHMIFDRILLSEVVYNKVFKRDDPYFTEVELEAILRFGVRPHRPILIHCIRDFEDLKRDYSEREQMFPLSGMKAVLEEYQYLVRDWSETGYFRDSNPTLWCVDWSPSAQGSAYRMMLHDIRAYLTYQSHLTSALSQYLVRASHIKEEIGEDTNGKHNGYDSDRAPTGRGHAQDYVPPTGDPGTSIR